MKALFMKSATSPLVIKYVDLQNDNTFFVRDEVSLELNAEQKASTELFDQIDKMLVRNKLEYGDIDQIYMASGPGSYTGARLLVTIIKAIVFVYPNIAVFDASLLDIFLQASRRTNNKGSHNYGIVPARKNKYYVTAEVEGKSKIDQIVSTMDLQQLIEQEVPCFVNGVEVTSSLNLDKLNNTLAIADWLAVSQQVADVALYEPYYLEEVNIG